MELNMSLDLRNFIQVNINYHSSRVSSVERGIVTLITKSDAYSANPFAGKIFKSYLEYSDAKSTATPAILDTSLDPFVASFFANKGRMLQIIGGFDSQAQGASVTEFIEGVLAKLDYRFVIIVSDADYEDLFDAANQLATTNTIYNAITGESSVSTFSGINEKFFISSTDTDSPEELVVEEEYKKSNLVLKYGRRGIEMLAAAYLSSADIPSL